MSWFDQIYRSVSTTLDELISKWEHANPDIVYDNAIQELKRQHQQLSTMLAGIIVQKEKNEGPPKEVFEAEELNDTGENNDIDAREKQLRRQIDVLREKIACLKKEKIEQKIRDLTTPKEDAAHSALMNVRRHIMDVQQAAMLKKEQNKGEPVEKRVSPKQETEAATDVVSKKVRRTL